MSLCIFCCSKSETVKHILWDCLSTTDVWGAYGKKVQKSIGERNTFIEVLEDMIVRCTSEELELQAINARRI